MAPCTLAVSSHAPPEPISLPTIGPQLTPPSLLSPNSRVLAPGPRNRERTPGGPGPSAHYTHALPRHEFRMNYDRGRERPTRSPHPSKGKKE
jgi:hypothetical protein